MKHGEFGGASFLMLQLALVSKFGGFLVLAVCA
jgi:hypothetical protein